jgi:hypothetical protein
MLRFTPMMEGVETFARQVMPLMRQGAASSSSSTHAGETERASAAPEHQ